MKRLSFVSFFSFTESGESKIINISVNKLELSMLNVVLVFTEGFSYAGQHFSLS